MKRIVMLRAIVCAVCLGSSSPAVAVTSLWQQSFTVSGAPGETFEGLQIDFVNESGLVGAPRYLNFVSFGGVVGQPLTATTHTKWGWGIGIYDPPFEDPGPDIGSNLINNGGVVVEFTLVWELAGNPANNAPAIRSTPTAPAVPDRNDSWAFGSEHSLTAIGSPVLIPEPSTIEMSIIAAIIGTLTRRRR